MDHQPNYYAIIPANVRYDKDLEPNAKLLYAEITALWQREGYCWASNAYFAELYGVESRTVRMWLESLKAKKYIIVEHETGVFNAQRKIWNPLEFQKCITEGKILPGGEEKNFRGGRKKISAISIQEINNTSNNTKSSSIEDPPILDSPDGSSNDDDDACGAPKKAKEAEDKAALPPITKVIYTKTNGKTMTLTDTEIYQHFIKLPYDPKVVAEAVERLRANPEGINNPLKYLESICLTIEKEKSTKSNKKSFRKTKNIEVDYTEPAQTPIEKPKNLMTMEEMWKKHGIIYNPKK